jgi:hypothetical protein
MPAGRSNPKSTRCPLSARSCQRADFARGTGVEFDIHTVRVSGSGLRRAARAGIGLIDPDWTRQP